MTIQEALERAEEVFGKNGATVRQSALRRNDGTIGVQCDVGYFREGIGMKLWGGETFEEAFAGYLSAEEREHYP